MMSCIQDIWAYIAGYSSEVTIAFKVPGTEPSSVQNSRFEMHFPERTWTGTPSVKPKAEGCSFILLVHGRSGVESTNAFSILPLKARPAPFDYDCFFGDYKQVVIS